MTVRILVGHVLERLRGLSAESVHCVVTSPPYYGLRDFRIEPQVWGDWRGSLGLEPTLALYLDHMVEVFREVRRVMRKDATCWLNIGDSYASSGPSGGGSPIDNRKPEYVRTGGGTSAGRKDIRYCGLQGFKPKDLMMIPARLAIRLQDDGWWVRSDIAWCKRAPMPESCKDRPTSAWEHVFLLTKSGTTTYWTHRDHEGTRTKPAPDYRWQLLDDHGRVREELAEAPEGWDRTWPKWRRINLWDGHDYFYDAEAVKEESDASEASAVRMKYGRYNTGTRMERSGKPDFIDIPGNDFGGGKRNQRNVWLLGPEPFPEAHFATFPTEIPRRAILAGTSERGVCPKCGAPWERVISKGNLIGPGHENYVLAKARSAVDDKTNRARSEGWWPNHKFETETLGWRPTCGCDRDPFGQAHENEAPEGVTGRDPEGRGNRPTTVSATVLDPFLGSGTTALVADRLGRDCIGIELSPEYAAMARRRIGADAPLLAEVAD